MELRIPVDGGYLWADDSGGDGPVLVLLHPGWGDSSIWRPVLELLPARYRVVRYDIRGFGKSPAPAAPFSHLGDLAHVLDIAARIPGCRQIPAPGADHLLPLRVPSLIAGLIGELA